jgi:hypothetical protein
LAGFVLECVYLPRFAPQMSLTAYHARYFDHDLIKRSSSASIDSLTAALADAQLDLNPHQVEAALFAFWYVAAPTLAAKLIHQHSLKTLQKRHQPKMKRLLPCENGVEARQDALVPDIEARIARR